MRTLLSLVAAATLLSACSNPSETEITGAGEDGYTARTRSTPVTLSTTTYSAGTLRFAYEVSGGCAEHKAAVKLVDLRPADFTHEGRLEIADVAAPDSCEAMVTVEGRADLRKLLRAGEPNATTAVVKLPPFGLDLSSARPGPAAAQPTGNGYPVSLSGATLKRDGTFSFGYFTAGGCAEHAAKVTVELRAAAADSFDYSHTAKVVVLDVPASPDSCEARISVDGSVDLGALIRSEAQRTGANVLSAKVELPPLEVTAN
ncbi:MAG: hypothetical protein JST00_17740 [Deltaproteobacteria bacterium]|nr:hypothetical protein [Deltaproteobacteria bacterium]